MARKGEKEERTERRREKRGRLRAARRGCGREERGIGQAWAGGGTGKCLQLSCSFKSLPDSRLTARVGRGRAGPHPLPPQYFRGKGMSVGPRNAMVGGGGPGSGSFPGGPDMVPLP